MGLTLLSFTVPDAPAGTPRDEFGDGETWVTADDAERVRVLDFAEEPVADRIEVTMFDDEVLRVTTAGGTATSWYGLMPRMAALQFLVLVLVAAGLPACAVALWRRRRDRESSWLGLWRGPRSRVLAPGWWRPSSRAGTSPRAGPWR